MEFGDLRGILHYVPQFRNKLFVIKIDGSVVHSDNFSNVVLDLAVLNSLKINFIIVHDSLNRECKPTSEEQLELGLNESSKLTNILMRELTAVGLKVATVNAVIARGKGVIEGVDYPHDGKVEKIDEPSLSALLDKGIVPIVPSIGFDTLGSNFILDSDSLAFSVGLSMGSSKVIMLVEPKILNQTDKNEYSVTEATKLAQNEDISGSRLSEILLTAANSFSKAIDRVHILNGFSDYAILAELFSNEGVGIMIHRDPYGLIRSADEGDVSEVISIIQSAILEDELLPRSLSELNSIIKDFYVLEIDGNVVGTVAIHIIDDLAELACLFVKKSHEGVGYGKRLVSHAVETAKKKGMSKIFALSTQAAGFFEKMKWEKSDALILPDQRRKKLMESGRNSKVFFSRLN